MSQADIYAFDPDAQPDDQKTITVCHVDDAHDVYGGRHTHGSCMGETIPPHKGWLGNPFRVTDYGRLECIEKFEQAFLQHLKNSKPFCNAVCSLPGQRVACHCRHRDEDATEGDACHLDVVRTALLDGRVFRIAHTTHDIALTTTERDRMADPEALL